MTVQLDQDLDDRVSAVAAALDQSKAWVIEQAVKHYVADQESRLAGFESDRREGVTWADLKARLASRSVITPNVSLADAVRAERDSG